ncbi:uracil-DNA glycosylase [Methylacidiphilum caldifontis]|uniref:uracil-DNA glycosylase n=1 Tax=Methylacidiphilum caldifontis TaxID=2795386 RepID=UPI001A8FCF20|nr:uracil-DNA glycosylase [Methylacidiphilum caldifontis]QSR88930.1 uracil-DNA glycosylase [Methylacidiphilum caldifontis]
MEKISHGKIVPSLYKYLEILRFLGFSHLYLPRLPHFSKENIAQGSKKSDQKEMPPSTLKKASSLSQNLSKEKLTEELLLLENKVQACRNCPHLVSFRTQTVFGTGNPYAQLMFVGEAPGAEEDMQGQPFVGPAGQLLTKMIKAMGLSREIVYIANVLKCRPDIPKGQKGNRKPTADEMSRCLPYLLSQIKLIKPKVIVALGATAYEGLTEQFGVKISEVRGRCFDFHGAILIPTYHPSFLLHNPSLPNKRKVWEDLLTAMEKLGMPISEKQRNYFLS